MLFVLTITVWALALQALAGFAAMRASDGAFVPTQLANGVVALTLLGLAAAVVAEAVLVLRRH